MSLQVILISEISFTLQALEASGQWTSATPASLHSQPAAHTRNKRRNNFIHTTRQTGQVVYVSVFGPLGSSYLVIIITTGMSDGSIFLFIPS